MYVCVHAVASCLKILDSRSMELTHGDLQGNARKNIQLSSKKMILALIYIPTKLQFALVRL